MSVRKYTICLTPKERKDLRSIVSKGVCPARTVRRAQVLLKFDDNMKGGCSVGELHDMLGVSATTIYRILQDFLSKGINSVFRKKRATPPVKEKITGEVEAHLIALVCHNPP